MKRYFSIRIDSEFIDEIKRLGEITKRSKNYIIVSILEHYFNSDVDIFELDKRQKRELGSNQKDQDILQADKKT